MQSGRLWVSYTVNAYTGGEDDPAYATVGTPNSVAVAPVGALIAVGGANVPQIAEVYTQPGA